MTTINELDIKNALVYCLKKVFTDTKFYKDGTIKSYPCFYISLTDIFINNIGLMDSELYEMNIFFKIEYHLSSDNSLISGFRTKMDEVGFKMIDCLRRISLYGKNYNISINNNEVIDGIRIFEGDFKIYSNYDKEEAEKMRKLFLEEVKWDDSAE